jgi:hypothetical protein
MGAFDFDRFNGFARRSLDDLLFADLWEHDIFNERDMHAAAYFYIRDYFRNRERDHIYVRCEPRLADKRPDIVVYERGKPIYVLEFKFFPVADRFEEAAVNDDLEKLAGVIAAHPSIRWGFFHMIYDADEPQNVSDARLRRAGYAKISVTAINARRREESGRKRQGYEEWRAEFDRLQGAHRSHAQSVREPARSDDQSEAA